MTIHYEMSEALAEAGKDHCSVKDLILHHSGLKCMNCGWTSDLEK